ncbi:kinase-like domain-containing protein [Favolaschia claudopus]|uniref:non-specific serine/threonine protein kinase n=1 Tax=Favolaschia claudopus TaxID=2862362 RepID=A0AAW0B0D9_9AGAR
MATLTTTHYRAHFGQRIRDGRFTVLRKLGEGITATTWLVRDSQESSDKYAALKVLSVEATEEDGPVRERIYLQDITRRTQEEEDDEGLDYLPALHDDFILEAPPTDHSGPQRHLCLVTTLYSTSVSALRRSSPTKSLPLYMTRSIIYMTVNALASLHSLKIVHTDVKLDNILFSNARFSLDAKLETFLDSNPAEEDPETRIPKSQPIPHEWTYQMTAHEAERMTVALIDFGHGKYIAVLLRSGFGPAIDIWAIGCLTFELLVGRWLFLPEDGGEDWSLEEDHLAKMMELTGHSTFPKSILDRAKNREKYFDEEGNLRRISELIPVTIEQAMRNYKIPGLSEEDICEAAEFIRACLDLDDEKRKTAKELVGHIFLKKAFSC